MALTWRGGALALYLTQVLGPYSIFLGRKVLAVCSGQWDEALHVGFD